MQDINNFYATDDSRMQEINFYATVGKSRLQQSKSLL